MARDQAVSLWSLGGKVAAFLGTSALWILWPLARLPVPYRNTACINKCAAYSVNTGVVPICSDTVVFPGHFLCQSMCLFCRCRSSQETCQVCGHGFEPYFHPSRCGIDGSSEVWGQRISDWFGTVPVGDILTMLVKLLTFFSGFPSLSSAKMQWHCGAHSSTKTIMLAANSRHCF